VRQDLVSDDQGARKWAGVLAEALNDILADSALYRTLPGAAASTGGGEGAG
jgi:predicted N-formylglutamate amidohydrolase